MSEAHASSSAAGRQFVTFWVQDEIFGVPLAEVQEIIRMPGVVRVPMASANLEGIANLRGAVLPITSLRRVFAMEDEPHDDATRVVVINHGALSGFVVDRMASVITTEAQEIEPIDSIGSTVRTELLQGVVKRDDGMILLLDPASLNGAAVPAQDHAARGAPGGEAAPATARGEVTGQAAGDELQLVSFEVANQEYAFPIEDVQEIVQVPPRINTVPRSESHVIGVMTLRNRLLPLVSLRRMFGMPQAPLGESNRIVVVSLRGGGAGAERVSVGIVMDAVKEVLRVARSLVEAVPQLLATGGGGTELEAICRLDGGDRLVTILSVEKMFPQGERERLLGAEPAATAASEEAEMAQQVQDAAAADDEEQFVVFRLGNEEYGVPIGTVQEIVRVPEQLTRVPKTPAFIEGVVNLRGVVLPVVDQRRRFGLPEVARNDRQRIMVLTVGEARTGFIVDSVVEVLKVARSTIGPAPRLSAEQHLLIDRVANLESQKRMLQLLEAGRLLSTEEQGAVSAL
ncbi:chemotaxis protein CheW [Paracraurococcus lichenis]|uniref:Chemotaxis protein CheW n=1 Tax=Paracraurococcus lichenis TaxID=3064888 RepID=A0ABT9E6M0_9PROT|nr:chemotaxis protein CheW [Paracraurococcus sp. LOR1-02]MDO9711695.1 chemotaxis protein CheW [Paracraurococcus sp. LOR1-02]